MLQLVEGRIELPALTTAHSHAFQRAMRGRAQRPGPADQDDFWTWRTAMYELAATLDPERIYQVSRVAYEELRLAGVRTVGEFHYIHHQPDGTPYDDRLQMSEAVIAAARDEGLRICLARVVYHRAGPGKEPEGVQRRFSDASLDDAIRDVEELWTRHADAKDVRIGVAPHSVRAVPPSWLGKLAKLADRRHLPLHMHVAEQPAEVEACLAETGKRPVQLLADEGVLSEQFVAVHATHLAPEEAELLGKAGAFVCLCPTTERDLGDGLPDAQALVKAGVTLCVGVDSHVLTSPLEDIRAVELGERLRTGKRVVLRPSDGKAPAEALWRMGSIAGARACGFDDAGGAIVVDRAASELMLVADEDLLDAIVFSGTDRLFVP
ncbi:MAG TPA: formimidoylglutamate deiminase [Polyangiaceae bacterium]|nr:formimidoylglutamate deiminase [Polyangiaceae bacterium]